MIRIELEPKPYSFKELVDLADFLIGVGVENVDYDLEEFDGSWPTVGMRDGFSMEHLSGNKQMFWIGFGVSFEKEEDAILFKLKFG